MMDSPIRKYFSLKGSLLPFKSHDNQRSPELDVNSVSYESTTPGPRSPVFIYRPLRRSMTEQRAREISDGLAIRSFSYDSVLAGKAPIIGGRPHKGNGPVKLQTSRRLSSGELLVTTQDHQRTLEDIREGEYIVGGVEKRCSSRASQIRSPVRSPAPSLRSPHSRMASSESSSPALGPVSNAPRGPVTGVNRLTSLPSQDVSSDTWHRASERRAVSPTADAEMRHDGFAYQGLGLSVVGSMAAVEEEPYRFSRSTSNNTGAQGTTLQALWKAERARLATICGHDRLSRRPFPTSRHIRRASPMSPGPTTSAEEDTRSSPHVVLTSSPYASFGQSPSSVPNRSLSEEQCTSDEASDYSSNKRSSLLCSEASSSSYTVRTSIFDEPTTREEVRRIVEDMRSTYLRAIEGKTDSEENMQRLREKVSRRPSLPVDSDTSLSSPIKMKGKQRRRSWDQIDPSAPKSTPASRRITADSMFGGISRDSAYSSSPEDSRSTLERADSLTLGTLMENLESSPRKSRKKSVPSPDPTLPRDAPMVVPV